MNSYTPGTLLRVGDRPTHSTVVVQRDGSLLALKVRGVLRQRTHATVSDWLAADGFPADAPIQVDVLARPARPPPPPLTDADRIAAKIRGHVKARWTPCYIIRSGDKILANDQICLYIIRDNTPTPLFVVLKQDDPDIKYLLYEGRMGRSFAEVGLTGEEPLWMINGWRGISRVPDGIGEYNFKRWARYNCWHAWSTYGVSAAVEQGRLDVLGWIHKKGYLWDRPKALQAAAEGVRVATAKQKEAAIAAEAWLKEQLA